MDKLNEDFTNLYKRWNGGRNRKEDKIDKEAVLKFINDNHRNIDENKITMHDFCVDYDGNIIINKIDNLTFKFGKVTGCFRATYFNLKNLKFMPKYVGGYLDISGNHLKSFKGCPEEVCGNFFASCCYKLESLEGLPKHIRGNLLISTPNMPGKFTKDDIPEGTVIDGKIKII